MGQKFYNHNNEPIFTVPKKDGSGLKRATLADAKRNGWFASVTTILDILNKGEGLTNWKIDKHGEAAQGTADLLAKNHPLWWKKVKKKAQELMSEGSGRGTLIHEALEHYFRLILNGQDLKSLGDKNPEIQPYLVALHYFIEEHNIKPHKIEEVVRVEDARTVGTCDFIGEFQGKLTLIDWKCKKSVYYDASYPMQLACYWKGLGGKGQICSVIIDTSGHYEYNVGKGVLPNIEFRIYEDPLYYYQAFKKVSDIYYHIKDWPRETK